MRKVIILALLLLATPALAIDADKVSHFGTSAGYGLVIGTATYHFAEQMGPFERLLTSTGLALVPGLAWEIRDEFLKNSHFGWDDLAVDALGALTGSVAAELINGQIWISASGRQIRLIGKW